MAAQEYYGSSPPLGLGGPRPRSMAPYGISPPNPSTPPYSREQQLPLYGYPSQGTQQYSSSEFPVEKVS